MVIWSQAMLHAELITVVRTDGQGLIIWAGRLLGHSYAVMHQHGPHSWQLHQSRLWTFINGFDEQPHAALLALLVTPAAHLRVCVIIISEVPQVPAVVRLGCASVWPTHDGGWLVRRCWCIAAQLPRGPDGSTITWLAGWVTCTASACAKSSFFFLRAADE